MDGQSSQVSTNKLARTRRHNPLIAIVSLIGICIIGIGGIFVFSNSDSEAAEGKPASAMDPKRAHENIKKICSFGTRISGSSGMKNQQDWLQSQFNALGGKVDWQDFSMRHPLNGETVPIRNMIVRYGAATKERLLVMAHYDTRPYPDMDPVNPRGLFLGANDGASGPALMLEMASTFQTNPPAIGVDFVLVDAEEFVFQEGDEYFIGSSHFARSYLTRDADAPTYREGVLVDMIADKNLELYYEENSLRFAPDLTKKIWKIAKDLKVKEFVPKTGHFVSDDHVPLNKIARIPVCDVIDFDYPIRGKRGLNYWHTTQDLPDKCSGESVCKVATVLLKWVELETSKTSTR